MIESLRISGCATFTGEPSVLTDLRKVNYFFGMNGSGKTTISRVISGEASYPDCEVVWRDGAELGRFVYNRDFARANFSESASIRGVFTLGEEHIELRKRLEDAKGRAETARRKAAALETERAKRESELAAAEARFAAACWDTAQEFTEEFKEAMRGVLDARRKVAEKVLEECQREPLPQPERTSLKDRYDAVFAPGSQRLASVERVDGTAVWQVETDEALSQPILGSDAVELAGLIERLGNSDWVKQGRPFLERAEGSCPFCQQATPESLQADLEAYFDESFEERLNAVQRSLTSYRSARTAIGEQLTRIEASARQVLDQTQWEVARDRALARLDANLGWLQAKLDEPSQHMRLEGTREDIDALNALIDEAAGRVREHNAALDNRTSEQDRVRREVWGLVVAELRPVIDVFVGQRDSLIRTLIESGQAAEEAQREESAALEEVRECEQKMTGVGATVEAINGLLVALGFSSFSIDHGPEPDSYRIVRQDGSDALETLSEGERSFITFLYFFHLVRGGHDQDRISGDRVVVIDDPVSSLDAEVLFVVAALTGELAREVKAGVSNVKQLFLLTHNVFFHREWVFDQRRRNGTPKADVTFWMVRKRNGVSHVSPADKDPVSTSYDLLWEAVRDPSDDVVGLQNAMRRILENYFRIVGPAELGDVEAGFEGRERIICRSLLKWAHAGSHRAMDDLYVTADDGTELYLRVFKAVFEGSGHERHFRMMMSQD